LFSWVVISDIGYINFNPMEKATTRLDKTNDKPRPFRAGRRSVALMAVYVYYTYTGLRG